MRNRLSGPRLSAVASSGPTTDRRLRPGLPPYRYIGHRRSVQRCRERALGARHRSGRGEAHHVYHRPAATRSNRRSIRRFFRFDVSLTSPSRWGSAASPVFLASRRMLAARGRPSGAGDGQNIIPSLPILAQLLEWKSQVARGHRLQRSLVGRPRLFIGTTSPKNGKRTKPQPAGVALAQRWSTRDAADAGSPCATDAVGNRVCFPIETKKRGSHDHRAALRAVHDRSTSVAWLI